MFIIPLICLFENSSRARELDLEFGFELELGFKGFETCS